MPKFGYRFTYPDSSHTSGFSRLDINISKYPTRQHYDPEKLRIDVKSDEGLIESLTIRHPWEYKSTYQVLAGLVEMTDRNGKKEEAYTFGGSLKTKTQDEFTICTLESLAPIVEISLIGQFSLMFIEEIEILLARRRVALLTGPHIFEQRLINADPFTLYLACLN